MKPTLTDTQWTKFYCDLSDDLIKQVGLERYDGETYTIEAQEAFDEIARIVEAHMSDMFSRKRDVSIDDLEDRHLQIDLDDVKELLDYDIIVRTDGDDLTKYTGFELYNYKLGKHYGWVDFSDGSFYPWESKPLTEKEKGAVIGELGYQTEYKERDALHKLIDSLPPEPLRDYISDVREEYGVDHENEK